MSFKCEVFTENKWYSNDLRFATEQEASDYGVDLLMRWLVPTAHRATECDDPVNYEFKGWKLTKLTVESNCHE